MRAYLGISAYYHDSAAAIIVDGELVAAAQEERFSRIKHDASFPARAIDYALHEAGIDYSSLAATVFYEKPFLKFERLLQTCHAFAPRGLAGFCAAMPVWIKEKLFMKRLLRGELARFGDEKIPLLFPEHHLSHAASAFYPSPFEEAAIVTIDGAGEWATTTIGHGDKTGISVLRELQFPHSVGLLYSAVTGYCGFAVNSGEYKLMGLAPYGDESCRQTLDFMATIRRELVDIREDGSFALNMRHFRFATGLRMTDNRSWERLFGIPPRRPDSPLNAGYANLALAFQRVTEEIVCRLAATAKEITGSRNLVLAGGVALNCVANGVLLRKKLFDGLWIQPAAGDAGGAVGAAYAGWYLGENRTRSVGPDGDSMKGALLGPSFDRHAVQKMCAKYNAVFETIDLPADLYRRTAAHIADGKIVGWFQGRMEYGPRALGNRSILADARNPAMQKTINTAVKFRESFRPFAPAVLEEDRNRFFDIETPSPYMLFVAPVKEDRRTKPVGGKPGDPLAALHEIRSDIPAVTHVDYSARVQTVSKKDNPVFHELLREFKNQTGCGVLVNTSFNIKDEPIVCTPEDAYRCFMSTKMEYLVIGNFLFEKSRQPVVAME
jgi:carbamoyltransferase